MTERITFTRQSKLNGYCFDVLAFGEARGDEYHRKLAGLPIAVRQSGPGLAFAYLLSRTDTLIAGQIIADIRYVYMAIKGEPVAYSIDGRELGSWIVTNWIDQGSPIKTAEERASFEALVEVLDSLKSIARLSAYAKGTPPGGA